MSFWKNFRQSFWPGVFSWGGYGSNGHRSVGALCAARCRALRAFSHSVPWGSATPRMSKLRPRDPVPAHGQWVAEAGSEPGSSSSTACNAFQMVTTGRTLTRVPPLILDSCDLFSQLLNCFIFMIFLTLTAGHFLTALCNTLPSNTPAASSWRSPTAGSSSSRSWPALRSPWRHRLLSDAPAPRWMRPLPTFARLLLLTVNNLLLVEHFNYNFLGA